MPTIPNIQPDPLLPEYRYNVRAGRYIDDSGRFVPQQTIRLELDKVVDTYSDRLANLGQQFRTGQIDGRAFQYEAMALIKQTNLAGAAMEKGGWFNMTQADFGRTGQIVRGEYDYFRNLLNDIESGKQRLDGTLDVRLRQYGQNGRTIYHDFEREDRAVQGYDEARRLLNGRDNCKTSKRPGCIDVAARGWVRLPDVVMIGSCTCLNNCRCDMQYRNSETGEVV